MKEDIEKMKGVLENFWAKKTPMQKLCGLWLLFVIVMTLIITAFVNIFIPLGILGVLAFAASMFAMFEFFGM